MSENKFTYYLGRNGLMSMCKKEKERKKKKLGKKNIFGHMAFLVIKNLLFI